MGDYEMVKSALESERDSWAPKRTAKLDAAIAALERMWRTMDALVKERDKWEAAARRATDDANALREECTP